MKAKYQFHPSEREYKPARKSEGAVALFIKESREAIGMSKNELGRLSEVNRTTIVMMEQSLSTPKFDHAYRMIKALGKTMGDLEDWMAQRNLSI